MLRPAVPADLRRLVAIRDESGADALSDPALIAGADLARLIAAGAVSVWQEDGEVEGFAAVNKGAIYLLVDTTFRGKGVGRTLLDAACAMLKAAGAGAALLGVPAGGSAEPHYRKVGWSEVRRSATGGLVLQKPL